MDIDKESSLAQFNEAINSHQSIVEFNSSCKKMLSSELDQIKQENRLGIFLSDLFDKAYKTLHTLECDPKITTPEEDCIKLISEESISGEQKVKDIAKITIVNENDKRILRFALLPQFKSKKNDPNVAREKLKLAENKNFLYTQSILNCIITCFESYLETLYKSLSVYEPEKYFDSVDFPFHCIFNDNLNQIIGDKINKSVEDALRDAIQALEIIKKNSSIDIDRYAPLKKQLIELNCRRNSYVHSEGRANNVYLKKVDASLTKGVKVGQKLDCDENYMARSLELLKIIICTLYCELLKHIKATQKDFENISNVGFAALTNGEYSFAEHIYAMFRRNDFCDFEMQTMCNVNYLNARKQQGKDIQEDLLKFDVSAMTMNYKIAKECLLDNHEKVYDLINRSINLDYPNGYRPDLIRDWPVFIDFRKSSQYDRLIAEHKSDFDAYTYNDDNSQNNGCNEDLISQPKKRSRKKKSVKEA